MSIRRDPIYVSTEVWRWLRLLAKAKAPDMITATTPERFETPDSIADQILRQAIREAHPQLAEHQKEIEKLEKQLIETLRK